MLMTNDEQLEKLKSGVEPWNAWRKVEKHRVAQAHNLDEKDTSYVTAWLIDTNMCRPELRNADLSKANLIGADLTGAYLWGANLSGTDLRESNLYGVELISADLTGTDLRNATLIGADLTSAKLNGTRLDGAVMDGTILTSLDLSRAEGLSEVRHEGPSPMSIGTVYLSKGEIPEPFLRGIGTPEIFITYMKSLIGEPLEFFSCFISYSTRDQDFADRLYADLQERGVRCWFAPHSVSSGKKLHEQIDIAIRRYDRLLLIISPASMSSEWVRTEIAKARRREMQEKRQILFPIRMVDFDSLRNWECFDADTGKDSAREIREYFIPDFSAWKDPDSYLKTLERLVRDLRAKACEDAGDK